MWETIKQFKAIIGIVTVVVPSTVAAMMWMNSNLVWSGEFNSFKIQEELRWSNYDEQRLRSEYYNLRNLRHMTPRDNKRMQDVMAALDHVTAKRLQLEQTLRRSHTPMMTR